MFPHFSLQRRPIYTYRRKTKPEFISDSSDDDSDLDDQKQQQRHTMVKVHEEGVSPFSGQTGAIEDKSFHIKSAATTKKDINHQKQPGEDNADEHVTPTVTMENAVISSIASPVTTTTLIDEHLGKTSILEHTMPPTYDTMLESHVLSLDTFTTSSNQVLDPLPTDNLNTMDEITGDIHLLTPTNEKIDFSADSTSPSLTQSSISATSDITSTCPLPPNTQSLNDTIAPADDDIFAFPTDPLVTSKAPKQKQVKKPCTKNDEMDIFDFPEDDAGEIRLMVASSLQTKSTIAALPSSTSSSSSFITPTSSSSSRKSRRQKSVRFSPNITVSTFRKTSLEYSEPRLYPMPCTGDQPLPSQQQPSSSSSSSLHHPPQKTSQKRKRNLVSRLKSANGRGINNGVPMPIYDFGGDDEEVDEMDTWKAAAVPESPERDENLPQDVWMKMIEEALNDNDDMNQDNEPRRPRYQPQNPMNVKVTYTRQSKKHSRNSQPDQELAELDNLLATLRNCK
ncbi:hypothetical protein K492DRAFT_208300 [Lichtheimia hyalospora FSU 10163]|nr:hypothetical protein K492DRAFT_208300 [Lichtheimia hyalospora FSU 10163]